MKIFDYVGNIFLKLGFVTSLSDDSLDYPSLVIKISVFFRYFLYTEGFVVGVLMPYSVWIAETPSRLDDGTF